MVVPHGSSALVGPLGPYRSVLGTPHAAPGGPGACFPGTTRMGTGLWAQWPCFPPGKEEDGGHPSSSVPVSSAVLTR